jgi:hypothetical protein
MIAFNLHHSYRGESHSETFLILAQTFLAHANDITGRDGRRRDIEWEAWGLSCAEPIRRHGEWTAFSCFVFGMRHILPTFRLRDDTRVMIVRDLCPRRCMRASKEERKVSDELHQEMGGDLEDHHPRSIVKCVPLPTSIGESSDVHLMISEDGIIILEVRQVQDCVFMAALLMLLGCRATMKPESS